MYKILPYLFCVLLFACQSGTKTTEKTTTSSEQSDSIASQAVVISDRLSALGLTADRQWRGVDLGMPIATVRTVEQGDLFEDQADHLGYAVDFPNLESMDALYFQTGGKVSAIEVDLYLNSQTAVTAYFADLTAYFNSRYGTGLSKSSFTTWTGPADEPIQIRDISKGKDFGIKIQIGTPPVVSQ